jgi:DNA-binding transcriptional LysR family regulator
MSNDLNLLTALRALLEEANVTRAGARINMGQSSMSAALFRLRAQFGDELLVRVGRDYELTPLARQLLPQVQLTLPLIEEALGCGSQFDPSQSYRTFSCMLSDFAALIFKESIYALVEQAPGIRVDLLSLPAVPTDSEHDLLAHDLVIGVPGIGITGEGRELMRDRYVCLVDRDHPAVIDGKITMTDFLRYPHVRADFGRAHLTPAERRLHELGVALDYRVIASNLIGLPHVVAGSDMIALAPSRLVDYSGHQTGTIGVPTPFGEVELIERMWWHPTRTHDQGHRWMRETLLAHWAGISGAGLSGAGLSGAVVS